MRRKKNLPFIPVQPQDQDAEFAGFQFQINDSWNSNNSNKFEIFRDVIIKLLMANYKWYGIENYERNMIEYMLINYGRVCCIKTEFNIKDETIDGVYFGRFGTDVDNFRIDFYGNPLAASCSGLNGQVFRANDRFHFALGFDTMAYYKYQNITKPIITYVDKLAKELDQSYQAWKVAAETRKCGMVFNCNDKRSANILKGVLKRMGENDPFIVVEGELDDSIDILFNTTNISGLSEYHINFMNCWGFILDLLGLENNSQNKRERLVVTEAEMNRSLSRYIGADRLAARKQFAEELNTKFNLNIKVENYLENVIIESGNEANIFGSPELFVGKENKISNLENVRQVGTRGYAK